MSMGLSRWFKEHGLGGLKRAPARFLARLRSLLEITTPEAEQLLRRITKMERDIFLPLKAAGIAMLLYSFYHGKWIRQSLDELSSAVDSADELTIAVEWTRYFLWYYIPANVLIAGVLLAIRRLPLGLVQWVVFASGLLDAIFLSALTVLTGGYQSFLFWFFLALIIRSAVSVPRATSQLALNFTIICCYVIAGVIYIQIASNLEEKFKPKSDEERQREIEKLQKFNLDEKLRAGTESPKGTRTNHNSPRATGHTNRPSQFSQSGSPRLDTRSESNSSVRATNSNLGLRSFNSREPDEPSRENAWLTGTAESPAEPLLVRLVLLFLVTVCSYGVQVLFERQRQAEEEAREFAVREGQLHSAGRMAAEFAHQIKNPLAIINNAAFSLQRALKEHRADAVEQIQIIQEEVERSDRIITQIMGYAQLSEGRVEKINVVEELEHAIERVFLPAVRYPIQVHRDYAATFPPLLMQRRHVSETFINLLQNAREALQDQGGNVFVRAYCHQDYSIEVSIRDDGPGIPPEKHERVFEAYYTTKEKGTGLGLATVKHNVELYGGTVRLDSGLGKGARFTLIFPAKTLIKLTIQS
jgi:signal transduction histidine kinase